MAFTGIVFSKLLQSRPRQPQVGLLVASFGLCLSSAVAAQSQVSALALNSQANTSFVTAAGPQLEASSWTRTADTKPAPSVLWRDATGRVLQSLALTQSDNCSGSVASPKVLGESYGEPEGTSPKVIGGGTLSQAVAGDEASLSVAHSRSTCATDAGADARTEYRLLDGSARAPSQVRVMRTFLFGENTPFYTGHGVRSFVAGLPLDLAPTVLFPNAANTSVNRVQAASCSYDCEQTDWNGRWYALDKSGQGILFIRHPLTSSEPALLNVRSDRERNLSSIVLLQPRAGWKAAVTEIEYLCAYDSQTWPETDRLVGLLPLGCRVEGLAYDFGKLTSLLPSLKKTSSLITLPKKMAAARIAIGQGEYSINGAPFTSNPGIVQGGDRVALQMDSASANGATAESFVDIGGKLGRFSLTSAKSSAEPAKADSAQTSAAKSAAVSSPAAKASTVDTTPDTFTFTAVVNATPGTLQTSNTITVSGINAAAPISVAGGAYSINGGAYTSAAGSVLNGDTVTAQMTAPAAYNASATATVTIGGVPRGYKVTTRTADTTPDKFSFASVTGANPGSTYNSASGVVTSIDIPVPITVSGGQYSVNNGPFTSASGTVAVNDVVVAQVVANSTFGASTTVSLTVGGANSSFKVTTRAADIKPDSYSFITVSDALPGSVQTSNEITISGIEAPSPISISSGSYSINGAAFTTAAGQINLGDRLVVRTTASATAGANVKVVVYIGGISGSFTVGTASHPVVDTTPDAFSFAPVTNAALNSLQTSNAITVSGIDSPASISISGGSYSVDGSAYTSATGTVSNGQTVTVQQTASASYGATTSATLTIGGVSGTYSVSTVALVVDTTPDAYSFSPAGNVQLNSLQTSNTITVSGINTATSISIVGGGYSLDSGPYTNAAGTVSNGQTVTVQQTASASYGATTIATLTIGGVDGVYYVTTAAFTADTTPDAFGFNPINDAPLNSLQTSNAITVSGINTATPISIVGGAYSLDNGPYTSDVGTVSNGQTVTVQQTASASYGTTTTATLTIGGVAGSFNVTTVALVADTTPDTFSFNPVVDVPLNSLQTSNTITVSGINAAASISIVGGLYSLDNGPYTSAAGTVSNGQTVTVQQTASASYGTTTAATLTIGGVDGVYYVTTIAFVADTTPDSFSFNPINGAALNSLQTSNTITVSGINAAASISIAGGSYSLDNGPYTSAAGTVSNGQTVTVQQTASASYGTTTTATLTIGGVAGSFNVTTAALVIDTTPDAFSFNPVIDVPLNSLQTSNTITVSGINTAASISIVGGSYSLNNGPYTSAAGTVSNGQTVTVQQTASASYGTTTAATLTIGGVDGVYYVTTIAFVVDTTPDSFSFNPINGAALNSLQTSNTITVSGINAAASISIAGGSYSLDNGPYTSAAGTVSNGQTVTVQQTASASYGTTTTATLTIGGVAGSFNVTTAALVIDTTPDAFSFNPVIDVPLNSLQTSNTITVSGINTAASISIVGGSYSLNNGPYTSAAGTVSNGQTVTVQQTASASYGTTTAATLTIGGVDGVYYVTTTAFVPDNTPDSFSFDPVLNAPLNSLVTSSTVTVSGINTAAPISIVGGSYSINNGPYTSAAGTVSVGQTVTVQQTSSASYGTTTTATLTIGGIDGVFYVTTAALVPDTTPDSFSFNSAVGVLPNSVQTSNAITVAGINTAAAISVVGGSYSINNGPYTSAAGTVSNGQTVTLRQTASGSYGATTTATLTIGGVSGSYSVSTVVFPSDTTPNDFTFTAVGSVAINSLQTSNAITVSGITSVAPISVSNGSYSIDGGPYTTTSGTVFSGQSVTVQLLASASYNTSTIATLTVGTLSKQFKVTTRTADTTPDKFTFASVAGATPSTIYVSNTVVVTGIDVPVAITVSGGLYSINDGPFVSSTGMLVVNDRLTLQGVAPSTFDTSTVVSVVVSGSGNSFKIATRTADIKPDSYTYGVVNNAPASSVQISNEITITGIEAPSPITITSGSYSINGGSFTSSAGNVGPGDRVRLSVTASATAGSTVKATTNIGGISGYFSVSTGKAGTVSDTTPDAFAFSPVSGVVPGSVQTSNAITVSGTNAAAPISITGGSYSINNGPYTSASSMVAFGGTVTVRQTASASNAATTTATLTIGGVSAGFAVTTAGVAADTTPDAFSFPAVTGAGLSVVRTSNTITVSGINAAAPISIVGGTYSVDGGSYTSASGSVSNGQAVTLRLVTSADPGTTTTATLTIGGVSGTYSVTTTGAATTPDAFSFNPVVNAPLSSLQTSNAITVSGINASTSISIIGGSYSINGNAYTSAAGTVTNGQTVTVQLTASGNYSTATAATLTIGGVTGSFNVTTVAFVNDTTPDNFSFSPAVDVPLSSLQTSNAITVSGINTAAPISIVGGSYSINGGAYTSAAGTVTNGQTVTVQQTASANYGATTTASLTIGGVSGSFSVTTVSFVADTTPDSFSFNPVADVPLSSLQTSNTITVTGINTATPISITGGSYSINNGAYSSADGSVTSGQTVTVQQTASASYGTITAATLTIGGVARSFNVTTVVFVADTTPDAFSFPAVTGAGLGVVRTSNTITVSGINAAAPISITGGTYSLDGGSYTSAGGNVSNGQAVTLRLVTSSSPGTTTIATLTIGGVSGAYSVTTQASVGGSDTTPDSFSFAAVTNAFPRLGTISAPVTITGIDTATPISISNGQYSVNGAPFVSAGGVVNNGDVVRAFVIPGPMLNDVVTATLTVGTVSANFSTTTQAPVDVFPEPYVFVDNRTAPINSTVTSEPVIIHGINSAAPISISSPYSYSVNGGPFTTAAGTVVYGDSVRVQAVTGSGYATDYAVTLTIGGYAVKWPMKTMGTPSQPGRFTLVSATTFPQGLVLPNSVQQTVPVPVTNLPGTAAVSVSGANSTYSINGGAYTSAAGTIRQGDVVTVRFIASASYSTSVTVTLKLGNASATLTAITTIDPVANTPTTATGSTMSYIIRNTLPVPLRIFVFYPPGWKASDRRSAYVDWYGGGWAEGNVSSSAGHSQYWSSEQGMVAFSPDYRVNDRFGQYGTLSPDDARYAVKWIEDNAAMLGVDPTRVAVGGSSAGGGNAFWAGLLAPPVTTDPASTPSIRPAAIVLRNAVADTTYDGGYLIGGRYGRFNGYETEISGAQHVDSTMPPVIMWHGDKDDIAAEYANVNLCTNLRRMGRVCEFYNEPGLDHFWFGAPGKKDESRAQNAAFFIKYGLLPAIKAP